MTLKKAFAGSLLIFLITFAFGLRYAAVHTVAAQQPPTSPTVEPSIDDAIRAAFQQSVDQHQTLILGFQVYDVLIDHIQYSNDGQTALLWLALQDRETGEVTETEPGLSIAKSAPGLLLSEPSSWNILLQAQPDFTDQLRALPEELLTSDIQDRFLSSSSAEIQPSAALVFTGYKLPWTAGTAKRVTNSIGHVISVSGGLTSCATTCRYAFDFADGTMFPMLAAKGGMVKSVKWTCSNFDQNCTNYLILEDPSTSPTSYQVYYHLAHNSIPQRLREIGAVVRQGEFIGDADDTGFSTGHHLHYHVYTSPTAANWTWGHSVDITFADVTDNGGRPRTCAEAREVSNLGSQCQPGNLYTSGNTPANPPSGMLTQPSDRQVLTSRMLRVQGSASDDLQITRILVQANYDGTWKTIDDIPPNGNGPFSTDIDLCSANIPDGPFALTVRIFDREGSQAPGIPVRQLIKNFSNCATEQQPPASTCVPDANQVALYAEPDYRGACKKFNLNNSLGYTVDTFGALGDNNAESIQVGANVTAVVYDRSSDVKAIRPTGRVESFTASDPGLSDNRVSSNTASGLWVVSRTLPPLAPVINPIGNRVNGTGITSVDSLVLSWDGGERAAVFDTLLTGPILDRRETVQGNSISVGNLPEGSYIFSVTARNANGEKRSEAKFTVTQAALPETTAKSVPYVDLIESGTNGWTATGLWRLGSTNIKNRGATQAWIFNRSASNNYVDTTYRAGDLTSPPITLPTSGTYYLNYAYFMDTEGGGTHWDQRSVQISQNGGPFHDIHRLSDDKLENGAIWIYSTPISLKNYAGSTVRLRFHFDTLDEDRNTGVGWVIDDVKIDTQGPNTACADTNNTPETATPLAFGSLIADQICPNGDLDYYKVTARAGQQIVVDINAKALKPASKLDAYVQLIDADGRSVIAENDDEVLITVQDSLLSYVISRPGTYYIKVKAWNSPGVGGPDYYYQMYLSQDIPIPPRSVNIIYPASNKTAVNPYTITATAADFDGQPVSKVEFYWHCGDWNASWIKLGTDIDGSDGWNQVVDPKKYGTVGGGALYVQAISRTGGSLGMVRWDLVPDESLPTSALNSLPAAINTNAIGLRWTASDAQNDIDRFRVEYQVNNGGGFSGWQAWNQSLPGYLRSAWFVGTPGSSYRFRMQAVDKAGNIEAFPAAYEAATTLASSCTPDIQETGVTSHHTFVLARGTSPVFNICKSQQNGSDDVDWIEFQAQAGEELTIKLKPQGGGTSLTASLYSAQSQLLGNWKAAQFEAPISIKFTPQSTGTYYLEIKPTQPELFGTDMKYLIWSGIEELIYLPFIHR